MILHGIENPNLKDVDSLSEANTGFDDSATLVLANPPFKGSLDREAVDPKIIRIVDSKKTELLFLALMIKGTENWADGVPLLSPTGSSRHSKAHQQIRKEIIDHQRLQQLSPMPGGVFNLTRG